MYEFVCAFDVLSYVAPAKSCILTRDFDREF